MGTPINKTAPLARVACGVMAMWVACALAQTPATPNPASPTGTKPATTSSAKPAASTPAPARAPSPRQTIELTPAERQAIDARVMPVPPPRSDAEELVPTAADMAAPPPPEEPAVRIEQIRSANRVTEIKVLPSFGGPGYVMTNREGRQPFFQTDMGPGLSVPKFFRWEFGGAASPPVVAPPPPPTR